MNEQQLAKSEQIASKIMRVLAIIGLVSILALIAWIIVQGFRIAPDSGTKMGATVSSITSLFRSGSAETLTLDIDSRTINTGASTEIRFVYQGAVTPTSYQFSYACSNGVSLSIQTATGVRDLACSTPLSFEETKTVLVFSSNQGRFADTELTVTNGALKDTVPVTIVNTALSNRATTTPVTNTMSTTTTRTDTTKTPTDQPVTSKPAVVKPTHSSTKPIVTHTPADLSLSILETGVLARVSGKNRLISITPVPSDTTAAVTFKVTNRGGTPSGTWAFRAELPIEGDPEYRYVSPMQPSLAPGAEIEFTLGFDEVLEAKTGTIKIELVPTNKADKAVNNTDAVRLDIKKA